MFKNCSSLTSIDVSNLRTDNAASMKGMFYGCTSLTELDLSTFTNNSKIYEMQDMFRDCTNLTTVTLNNEGFKTRTSTGAASGSVQMQRMFTGCNNLKTVDMSNITIYGRSGWTQLSGMFKDNTSLETVKLNNTKVPYVSDFGEMFSGCTGLKTVELNNFTPTDATNMYGMFYNCSSLENLDISSFGTLNSIYSMEDFVKGCTSIKELNISNLNNANASTHMLGIKSLSSLEKLIAKNSEVWMINNNANGTSVPYENISEASKIDFFTDGTFKYTGDDGSEDTMNARGVMDLIVDPNANPVGKLAPGTYERTSETSDDFQNVPLTYYLVNKMQNSTPTMEIKVNGEWKTVTDSDTYGDYVVEYETVGGKKQIKVFTKLQNNVNDWRQCTNSSDDVCYYSGEGSTDIIRITYPNSATDINGCLHDTVVTIDSVSFHNMNRIPVRGADYPVGSGNSDPWADRSDGARVPDDYARYIINAETGELRFWNQILDSASSGGTWQLSKGSGTYIDYRISIKDAPADTSVLYWVDDLDLPSNEIWDMHPTDPEQDVLTSSPYGHGSEGMVLGEGNDLSTVAFANHTGLQRLDYASGSSTPVENGNYIVGTGTDPMTSWSRFYVLADAQKANYTWTSATSCETSVLKNTTYKHPDILSVYTLPTASKTVSSVTPTAQYADMFEFNLEPADDVPTVDYDDKTLDNKAIGEEPETVNNDSKKVEFSQMKFDAPSGNCSEEDCGVDAYVYKVSETQGTDMNIQYDDITYYVKYLVSIPTNDTELRKGTKITIIPGERAADATEITWHEDQAKSGYGSDTQPIAANLGNFNNIVAPEEETETKTITRTITYTEYDENGAEVAETKVQTANLKRVFRKIGDIYVDKNGKEIQKDQTPWEIDEDADPSDISAVTSPTKDGWTANKTSVPAWNIDFSNPADEVVRVFYEPIPEPEVIPADSETTIPGVPKTGLSISQATSSAVGSIAFMILVVSALTYLGRRRIS